MTLIFRGRNLSPLQISNETIDAWDVITLFLLFEKQNASGEKALRLISPQVITYTTLAS